MCKYISHFTIISYLLFCTACDNNDTPPKTGTYDAGTYAGTYNEGDFIRTDHREMEFDFCYPTCGSQAPDDCVDYTAIDTTFSFSHYPGKVFMIEMSASW